MKAENALCRFNSCKGHTYLEFAYLMVLWVYKLYNLNFDTLLMGLTEIFILQYVYNLFKLFFNRV